MSQTKQERNKALVHEAFDTLFNKREYVAAERYWSPTYIQHSAHIGPGREGLFNLIKSMPPTLKYEPGMIVADGNLVIVHGRFSGFGAPQITAMHFRGSNLVACFRYSDSVGGELPAA